MKFSQSRWGLGAKLVLIGTPFLLLALLSTVATLWVSWQLDGGAAAVNEAGRMRMQAYRMALTASDHSAQDLPRLTREFEQSLGVLRHGDPERPLFVPWDERLSQQFTEVERLWQDFQKQWLAPADQRALALRTGTAGFVAAIDKFVAGIEEHMARWTSVLHLLQMGILVLAVLGSATILFTGYLFVLEPVGLLKQAIQKIQGGDLGARVERVTTDEFGTLADGFNGMAEHLQSMYRNLESKVLEKTAELEEKRGRLESLYEVTALVARATTLEDLARDFSPVVMRIARADGVALRWTDQTHQRYLMLAANGLPEAMVREEHCIDAGSCHCGVPQASAHLRVIPIVASAPGPRQHCIKAGFSTVVNIPIRLHERLMGEVTLFYHAQVEPAEAERSLLEAVASHLASAMENLRLNALEKEAAVSEERQLIASELHDSIAQSLAFLKIQVQLMRDAVQSGSQAQMAQVLDEIDVGVRESYGDVRELLLHFRTRAAHEDIEPALATTLRKFEHQTGLTTALSMAGQGMPLPPDVQIQVLHIVQEALSNVRKHARASRVWLQVDQQPQWRFEVRDNGIGFEAERQPLDETHVGLRIMQERAQRIGATLELVATPERGTSVILTLPAGASASQRQGAAAAPAGASQDAAALLI